ncbi:olfactory receptor 10A7-like [Hyperolius riggenbachi]|uniref:olfactory receptor 10A7-like n=1 Tax=Hyperolius riggenbachi TaxID=752182 RepID=UPI0035A2A344
MDWKNQTSVTEFWLLGFHNARSIRIPLFVFFLAVYISILSGNFLIIALVVVSQSLKSPMYFFLANLSTSDLLLTTIVIPTMLSILLKSKESISFAGCISQFYLFGLSAITECFLLTVMSYDRYLAICDPLHYFSIMDSRVQVILVTCSWVFAFSLTLITVSHMWQLQFCGPNVIDHFFCDITPLLELSCSDTSVIHLLNLVMGLPVTMFPIGFIIITYVYILTTILKISTISRGKQKAFSTCSSHLAVVCTYYGTLITLYVIPTKGLSPDVTKVQSLLYTIVTPLFNPVIYSLRNNEIRTAIQQLMHRRK